MTFYNEFDSYAAEWLRQLQAADGFRYEGEAPMGNNSFGQGACDTLGKEPKPYLAISYLPGIGVGQNVDGLVCVPPPQRALHRSSRSTLGRLDYSDKTGCYCLPAIVLLLCALGKFLPFGVCEDEILGPILPAKLCGNHSSKPSDSLGLVLVLLLFRNSDNCVQKLDPLARVFSSMPLCSVLSNIFDGYGNQEVRSGIRCNEVA